MVGSVTVEGRLAAAAAVVGMARPAGWESGLGVPEVKAYYRPCCSAPKRLVKGKVVASCFRMRLARLEAAPYSLVSLGAFSGLRMAIVVQVQAGHLEERLG